MKIYKITLTRETSEYVDAMIVAESEEAAIEQALMRAATGTLAIGWEAGDEVSAPRCIDSVEISTQSLVDMASSDK